MKPFKLERYFARYEFTSDYLLSPSDCESISLDELLNFADPGAKKLWENLSLGYTESQGHPLLLNEIAKKVYNNMYRENILTVVPAEGIFIALNGILTRGDHVIVIYPAYQSLYEIPLSMGCEVTKWKVQPDKDKWNLDLEQLKDSITSKTRLIILNFPHNPTGYLPDQGFVEEIVKLARQHDIYIFSDEMYRFTEYNDNERLDSLADIYEKGISLSGLSKSFGLPGLRIGWLATGDINLLKVFKELKDYTTICNSAPSEILAIIALRSKEKIINRNLEIIQKNIKLVSHFFDKYRDIFKWLPPQAGSVAFPLYRGKGSVEEFCQRVVEEKNTMLLPGSVFDFPGNYFRIGLGRKDFYKGLKRLEEYINNNY